jgi:drug/metabolite transporter (DMT)-like permease
MSYAMLGIAGLLFSFQFVFSKWYQLRTDNSLKAALWMTVFDGAWLSAIFFVANGFCVHITAFSAWYAIYYSFFIIVCSVSALFALRYGKVSLMTLFMLAGGLVLPVVYGVAALGETLIIQKGLGLVLIFFSFFPGFIYKKKSVKKEKQEFNKKRRSLFLYFTVFVCNGMIGVITKAHSISVYAASEKDFLIFAALLRLVVGLILISVLIMRKKPAHRLPSKLNHAEKNERSKGIVCLLLIVGGYTLCNGVGNYFSMVTAKVMDSSLQFPVLSATVVVLTALISWAIYKEKPSTGDTVGILLNLGGIALMII